MRSEEPRKVPATSLKTVAKFKATCGRGGGRQHGKRSFKITSGTLKRKIVAERKGGVTAKSKGGQKRNKALTSSRAASVASRSRSYQSNTGDVFLKHLNFRPIQADDETSDGSLSPTHRAVSLEVAYQSWLQSNASEASSFTSQIEVDLSSVEMDACGDEEKRESDGTGKKSNVEDASQTEINEETDSNICQEPHATVEISQACSTDAPAPAKMSTFLHPAPRKKFCSLQEVLFPSRSAEANEAEESRQAQSSRGSSCPVARSETGTIRTDKEDELLDGELWRAMRQAESRERSLRTSPRSRGRTASGRCGTPHVSQVLSVKTPPNSVCCSTECSMGQMSGSQPSSESASGNLSHAFVGLDEVSRERVQKEFDQRLGKYISMLCGDTAESSAFRRLHERLLKQKHRASLSHTWTGLASKVGRKSGLATSRIVQPDKTPFGADEKLTTEPEAQTRQQDYSFNKKEEPFMTSFDSKPPLSRRPHSSPAKDKDLVNLGRRNPTPSLRYLLKYAISTNKSQVGAAQIHPSEEKSRSEVKTKSYIGDYVSPMSRSYGGENPCVCSKPPAWRAAPQTDRMAQTDGSDCACGYRTGTRTSPVGHGLFFIAPTSPTSIEMPSSVKAGTYSPRRESASLHPSWRLSSHREFTGAKKSPGDKSSPLSSSKRTGHVKDGPHSARIITRLPPTPHTYSQRPVTSSVEVDLEKYNAVMDRCRALLGERDLEEDDSSTWTHSSCMASTNTLNGGDVGGNTVYSTLDSDNIILVKAGRTNTEQNMGDIFADLKDYRTELPSFGYKDKASGVSKSTKLWRSNSVHVPEDDSANVVYLPPKRSSSNPHYSGVVNFGSVEAIKRIVEPVSEQAKPKVTFDIDSDKCASSKNCCCEKKRSQDASPLSNAVRNILIQAATNSNAKKAGSGKKKWSSAKTSGKSSQKLKLKPPTLRATWTSPGRITDHAEITPRTTNASCTSRLPLRINPYYNPTLEVKRKRLNTPPASRPCSQTSWKTVDTDGTLRTPSEMANEAARDRLALDKKKKKRLKKKTQEVADPPERGHDKPKKPPKKKRKKKVLESKPAVSEEEQATGIQPSAEIEKKDGQDEIEALEPRTCVQVAQACDNDNVVAEDNQKASLVSTIEEQTREISVNGGPETSQITTAHLEPPTAWAEVTGTGNDETCSEKPPKAMESLARTACKDEDKSVEPRTSPVKQSFVSKMSSRVSHTRQRSNTSVISKSSALDSHTVKQQPGIHPSSKGFPVGGGSKVLVKPTVIKRYGYRPIRGPVKPTAVPDAAQKPDISIPPNLSGDTTKSLSVEKLEKCRQMFTSYKDTHPELAAAMDAVPHKDRTSMLRKAGPLVVALLIHWLVQYNYG